MSIADEQREHYGHLLRLHGDDPRTVGWNRSRVIQRQRFVLLSKLFEGETERFTVHEVGCGLGDFGAYLTEHYPLAIYSGSDICSEFVEACRERFPGGRFLLRDLSVEPAEDRYDFVTQSGLFNGRLTVTEWGWWSFITVMLRAMYGMARKGMASNFLTACCDPDQMRPELHYQPEASILNFVNAELSRHWELDASGPLYEYTLRVHRPERVRGRHPHADFDRYFE